MKAKTLLATMAALLIVGASMAQISGPTNGTVKAQVQLRKAKLLSQLNLSAAQKSEIKAIHLQKRAQLQQLRATDEMRKAKRLDARQIRKNARAQVLSVLTDQQRAKLLALRAERKARKAQILRGG